MLRFWWISVLLTAVFLTVNSGWLADGNAQRQTWEQQVEPLVTSAQDTHHREATLSDASTLYRVCSSRPQRLLPTHEPKTERNANPSGLVCRYIVKPLQLFYDSRLRLETAPFCMSASRDYYVIALRRIIR